MLRLTLLSTSGVMQVTEKEITKHPYVIGKEEGLDWTIKDKIASRRHMQLEKRSQSWWIRDLNSTNGTYVNGEACAEKALEHHHVIQIGETTFLVNLTNEEITPDQAIEVSRKIPKIKPPQMRHMHAPQESVVVPSAQPPQTKRPVQQSTQPKQQRPTVSSVKKNIPARPVATMTAPRGKPLTKPYGNDFSGVCQICGYLGIIAFLPAIILGHLDQPNSQKRVKQRGRGLLLGYVFLCLWLAAGSYYWLNQNPQTNANPSNSNLKASTKVQPLKQEEPVKSLLGGIKSKLDFIKFKKEILLTSSKLIWMPSESVRKNSANSNATSMSSDQDIQKEKTAQALKDLPVLLNNGIMLQEMNVLRSIQSPLTGSLRLILEDCFTNPTLWKYNTTLIPDKKSFFGPFIIQDEGNFFFFDRDTRLDMKMSPDEKDNLPWFQSVRGVEWSESDLKGFPLEELNSLRLILLIQTSDRTNSVTLQTKEGKPKQWREVSYPFNLYPGHWMGAILYQATTQKVLGIKVNSLSYQPSQQAELELQLKQASNQIIQNKPQTDTTATEAFTLKLN